ncbi:MAG: substrate-binding periplasmic protein [Alphaproteobacteria bacterium]
MNIFFKTIIGLFLLFATITKANAMLADDERNIKRYKEISVTGFPDYPPFGFLEEPDRTSSFNSVFKKFLEEYAIPNNIKINYKANVKYKEAVQDVRSGKINLIIGMYSETDIYNGIEYIYPSFINNPVHIIALPNKITNIKDFSDLQKMKGGINKNEHLSDFVNEQLNQLGVKRIEDSYTLYKMLFNGEIDYVIGSRYFNMIEASKLGLLNKVSFSKKPIWDMPMFIGMSKGFIERPYVTQSLSKSLADPENQKKINNYLIEMMNNIEDKNRGIVSPEFSRDK